MEATGLSYQRILIHQYGSRPACQSKVAEIQTGKARKAGVNATPVEWHPSNSRLTPASRKVTHQRIIIRSYQLNHDHVPQLHLFL
jgi:hypothetical protein